ncbi:hypothetical protein F892_01561 [Acinetobacter vivianii]|uniref:Uncharacterized protein n=1 Tax=Acinetobacter vivianii TaxID=1776742 RepID=N9NML4_9GAMM|nr:hypothetical protein [Acinetobacter vivianii]ENX22319.1 hypothetical protein F892_01561 [Acinetobacter vivianii]GGI58686.1 hypothetical protein GCM10011446_01810 [Acinetobacter vivianii]
MQKVSDYYDDFPEFNPANYDQEGNYKPEFMFKKNKMYQSKDMNEQLSSEKKDLMLKHKKLIY